MYQTSINYRKTFKIILTKRNLKREQQNQIHSNLMKRNEIQALEALWMKNLQKTLKMLFEKWLLKKHDRQLKTLI